LKFSCTIYEYIVGKKKVTYYAYGEEDDEEENNTQFRGFL